ncbi:MAG TPA: hypothetical protein VFZ27_06720 [Terriglobia bacterium]|nr:hypothetical protein [Terriglobia bacterium]
MKFHLEYQGKLPSQNAKDREARRALSHEIRQSFHFQLFRLWEQRFLQYAGLPPRSDPSFKESRQKYLEAKSLLVKGTSLRFLPIINKAEHLVCSLGITLYRHQEPGSFLGASGDLDNQLKVLFDAMSMPNDSQLQGLNVDQIQQPMFCLLEDDALIIDVRMRTVQLWTTYDSQKEQRETKVSVDVKASCTSFQGGYGGVAFPDL